MNTADISTTSSDHEENLNATSVTNAATFNSAFIASEAAHLIDSTAPAFHTDPACWSRPR